LIKINFNKILLNKYGFSKFSINKLSFLYEENNQNVKLACIHLDMDVYEPTKYCLDLLFPFLQKNGIIICDDYNQVDGATKAFDEFSEKHGKNISKLEFSKTPYFIENN